MTFRITLKDPDGFYDSIRDAAVVSLEETEGISEDEIASLLDGLDDLAYLDNSIMKSARRKLFTLLGNHLRDWNWSHLMAWSDHATKKTVVKALRAAIKVK